MIFRQPKRDQIERHSQPIAGGGNPAGATQLNAQDLAERLLSAADRAIDNALSGNSAVFLQSSLQTGGE
jgi:hypothetical protein